MLVDKYGKEVHPGDWFIRLDQHNEGRLYICEGYPETDKIAVHEHVDEYAPAPLASERGRKTGRIAPKRMKQTIMLPRSVIWYPKQLLPEIGDREQ